MPEKRQYDVFLSYSMKDRPWVAEFASALGAAGVEGWFDVSDITAGERWRDALQDALRSSTTLVVILSHNSLNSWWTFFELGAAFADRKRIIPVVTEDIDLGEVPLPLARLQILRESSPVEAGRRVAAVLKGHRPKA